MITATRFGKYLFGKPTFDVFRVSSSGTVSDISGSTIVSVHSLSGSKLVPNSADLSGSTLIVIRSLRGSIIQPR